MKWEIKKRMAAALTTVKARCSATAIFVVGMVILLVVVFSISTVQTVQTRKHDRARLVGLQDEIDNMQSREDRLRANYKIARAAEEWDRASALLRNANWQAREKKEKLAEAELLIQRLQ